MNNEYTITLKFRIYRRTDGNGHVEYLAKRRVGFFWVWFTEGDAGGFGSSDRYEAPSRGVLFERIQKYADRKAKEEYFGGFYKRYRKTVKLEIEEPTAVTGTFKHTS